MRRRTTGEYVTVSTAGERVRAFVPYPLPPDPPLHLEGDLRDALDGALLALGRLDSVSSLLPEPDLFLYSYVRKEAVLSSQIEGTQSSLSDLLLFEIQESPGWPTDDVTEVSQYVAALEHGLKRLRGGFPLSNRLIREIHAVLLSRGRGAEKAPGGFRRSQNWIGGTRPGNATFVPAPHDRVPACMGALDRFLHDRPQRTPALVKAALAHVQFETIHPFLDGNGRVGRLLITLVLSAEGVLREPLLYLSLHFKRHRKTYYSLLDQVRATGDWERWLAFFAEAVTETAQGAVETARTLVDLFRVDRARVQGLGRGAASALQVHEALQARPVTSIALMSKSTRLSVPTATSALERLLELDIVREMTGRRRNRVYAYRKYLEALNEETEIRSGNLRRPN